MLAKFLATKRNEKGKQRLCLALPFLLPCLLPLTLTHSIFCYVNLPDFCAVQPCSYSSRNKLISL
jgi:hypothetical protein